MENHVLHFMVAGCLRGTFAGLVSPRRVNLQQFCAFGKDSVYSQFIPWSVLYRVFDKNTALAVNCSAGECRSGIVLGHKEVFPEHMDLEELSTLELWLQQHGEPNVKSVLTAGYSAEGRALFATRSVKSGEQVLRVSLDLMITPEKLPKELLDLLPQEVTGWARLALFILIHQHAGNVSPWAPYIKCLPPARTLDNSVFWNNDELGLIQHSAVYEQTLLRRMFIAKEYSAVKPAMDKCQHLFGQRVTLEEFMYAYCIASSRSWDLETLGSIAMVPYVDFLNHDACSKTLLSICEDERFAEIVADKDYDKGSQIMITYGSLPNGELALDFGFTLLHNPFDQVKLWVEVPKEDPLWKVKLELMHTHGIETEKLKDCSDSGGNWFKLREVENPAGRGKGIPQKLLAFLRVISASSVEELNTLADYARRRGRNLAERPLKGGRESKCLKNLLNIVELQIKASVTALQRAELVMTISNGTTKRAQMARDLIAGELRVLRSVSSWLRPRAEGGGLDTLLWS